MSLGFTTSLAPPPLPSFSSTVQNANTQAPVKVTDVRPAIGENPVPLQSPFPPYPHPLLFGNHLGVPDNLPHPPLPNPGNFQMNSDNPLMSTMSCMPTGPESHLALQENWENWRQFQQAAWAHNLDPHMLAFYHNAGYSMDFANGPRRKNATRETTSMLKAWLNEHKKNPYPTKGEKIMLAIITKMSLTQVSTWFANARRRLKKENKMTWSPRNRAEDERDQQAPSSTHSGHGSDDDDEEGDSSALGVAVGDAPIDIDDVSNDEDEDARPPSPGPDSDQDAKSGCEDRPGSADKEPKPKIWSLVDLARKEPEGALTPAPLSPVLFPPGVHHLGPQPGPPCLVPHPHGAFPPGPLFPHGFPGKAFLPPPPPASAAAYIQAHPFLYPHYPSIGIHPFSAFSRPAFPLDAREPPKLTPEVLLSPEKELGLDARTDPSQFNTSKP